MNYYEITCLISPAVDEQGVQRISQKIRSFIQEESGNLERIVLPAKKNLIYFPKKQEESFLITAFFWFAPEKIENLLKKLKSEKEIIRYMLLNKRPPQEDLKVKSGFAERNASPIKNKKAELKEIDKKIEEILNE